MVLFCDGCNKKHDDWAWRTLIEGHALRHICTKFFKPAPAPEIVPQSIKNDRDKYAKSILQPWRGGEASAEFIEAYPDKAKHLFTPKERRKAKRVWKDTLKQGWEKSL